MNIYIQTVIKKKTKKQYIIILITRLYFEGEPVNIRRCASAAVIGRTRLSSCDKGAELGVKADMEELSAVGEQVFDAECILNKRLRKVRGLWGFEARFSRFYPPVFFCSPSTGCSQTLPLSVSFLSGKVGVSREVEGMVVQVSPKQ